MSTNVVQEGFVVKYELSKNFTVKSVGAGSYEGRNYSASLKLSARNIFERLNAKTNVFDEIVEDISFKIPAETDEQAGDLLDIFRAVRSNGEVITLEGNLPNQNGEVLVLNELKDFLSRKLLDTTKSKKAS